ncbi:MAG: hypothetical protein RIB32_02515 [Phycisphaerales bacterium]
MRTGRTLARAATLGALAIGPTSTEAGIISFTGPIDIIAPPASVHEGGLESDTQIRVFRERTNLELVEQFGVNITNPGTYSALGGGPNGNLAAGVQIISYMVHTDHVGSAGGGGRYEGSITFDTDILAIITSRSRLDSSDAIVGLPTVLYPTGVNSIERGTLDSASNGDVLTLAANRRTFTFSVAHSSDNIEQFRIITAIPAPGSLWIPLLSAVAVYRRRATPE